MTAGWPEVLTQMRDALLAGRYRFSDHAFEELEADSFHVVDAESAVLTGRIVRMQPSESEHPGPRYTVVGFATDELTELAVVCRFAEDQVLLIITVYAR